MGLIRIDDIKPGMILSSDLFTPHGRFLLPEGAVFTHETIKTCKAWGISAADIAGLDQNKLGAARLKSLAPEHISQSRLLIKPFFKAFDLDHPASREIYNIAVERIARKISSGVYSELTRLDPDEIPGPVDKEQQSSDSGQTAISLVRDQSELISLPDIFFQIIEVIGSPFSSAVHIADVVNKDSSLAAKLLKLVNSSFYGFPSKIDSISRAVTLLGTKEISSLALGISVLKVFEGIPEHVLNMEKFWKHSISCAVFSGLISSRMGSLSEERFFVAGLLHDLGRLIMIKSMPNACLKALIMSIEENIPLYQAEESFFGFNHARVGGLLCREWKMPVTLEEMVFNHHEPDKARNISEAGVVHLANILSQATLPEIVPEGAFPGLSETVWDSIGIDPSDLLPIVRQAEKQTEDIVQIFLDRE